MTGFATLLRPTEFLDFDTAAVREFVSRALHDASLPLEEAAVKLYYAVRDGIRYEIYGSDLSRTSLRASAIIAGGSGFCIHKSIVYAAAVRSIGIPSRLVFTDVRNHLASPRLRELVGGNVFHYHCLVSIYLNHRWIKVTPVFNMALCYLFGMKPLEFDGRDDSLHHPFDDQGRKYMEFIRIHGEFDDLPYQQVLDGLRREHPKLFVNDVKMRGGALTAEVSPTRAQESSWIAPCEAGAIQPVKVQFG
jgi:transglutaminase-like putative cysteine protease